MKSFLVLNFLCLSACVVSVRGSCFLDCLTQVHSNYCDCSTYISHFKDQGARQEHYHNHHHTHHPQETPSPEPETTMSPIRLLKTTTNNPKLLTTTDICDYLCKIQLGGDACNCSKPGLPGRK